jgi:predicted DNA-binding transcriptional regulator AlpA
MRYLSFSELRARIGNRSRNAIYRDVERGDLPAPFKLGRQLYWDEGEVEQALLRLRHSA